MRNFLFIWSFITLTLLSNSVQSQTSKDIQGTWRIISTVITTPGGEIRMDSANQNLTKIITPNRVTFTIYDKKTDSLTISGQGKAETKGDQYIERFEQSTQKNLLREPMIFKYKIEGNRLTYEGGKKNFHIVESLIRIE